MLKRLLYITIFLISFTLTSGQTISVINTDTDFPIPGVNVFSKNYDDTLQTNNKGEVSLDLFKNSDVIIFDHFVFSNIKKTKEQIIDDKYIVLMSPSGMLAMQNNSIITAEEYSKDLPFYINIVNFDDVSTLTTNEDGSGQKIMFEKNKGGSTIFRGFLPNKVVLVMDGVRLNNALYRTGKISGPLHFQNASIERVQQINGASYVMYGPDAVGGAIQYFTKVPKFSSDNNFSYKINTISQYETATQNWISNVNVNLSTKKFASYTSFTYGQYGKIKMGKNRNDNVDSEYGLNKYYIERINDKDSVLVNDVPTTQQNTDYKQYLFIQKFRYKPKDNLNIILNLQYNTSSEIGMYSALTEINRGNLRFAEVEFRPQNKFFSSVALLYEKQTKYYDFISVIGSMQYIEEYRYSRKYNSSVGLHQLEYLYDASINLDFVKLFNINRITYGIESSYNYLKSTAFFENVETDSIYDGLTRYPTYGTNMQTFSTYFTYKRLSNSQFIINTGVRLDYTHSNCNFEDQLKHITKNSKFIYNFDKVTYNQLAPSASLNFDIYPLPGFQISLLNSLSVHTPIVDEYGKIMLKDFVAILPNNSLKSEKSYNIELGVSQILFESIKINVGVFNSWMRDAIIVSDANINGIDSLYLGIDGYEIATKINIDNAQIYGISGGVKFGYYFGRKSENFVKFNSSANYIKGINKDENIALPNIPPIYGQTAASLKLKSYTLKFSHNFNGLKKMEELSIYGEDYIEKAMDDGFMAWQTYNIKLSYNTGNYLSLHFSVNNIFDTFYRSYASAVSAPGRNFIFTLKLNI